MATKQPVVGYEESAAEIAARFVLEDGDENQLSPGDFLQWYADNPDISYPRSELRKAMRDVLDGDSWDDLDDVNTERLTASAVNKAKAESKRNGGARVTFGTTQRGAIGVRGINRMPLVAYFEQWLTIGETLFGLTREQMADSPIAKYVRDTERSTVTFVVAELHESYSEPIKTKGHAHQGKSFIYCVHAGIYPTLRIVDGMLIARPSLEKPQTTS